MNKMKLKKKAKFLLILVLLIISLNVFKSAGNNSNNLEIIKWLWLFAQIPIYKIILEN